MDSPEIILVHLPKIMLAILCGAIIGFERQIHDKPAGLRTNILIATGSCIFVILSYEIAAAANIADPGRIAAQIVTGIGFLGAGTIIQSKGTVRGLTSAATIWVVASIGMASGMSLYYLAIFVTLVIVSVLFILGKVERVMGVKTQKTVHCVLQVERDPDSVSGIVNMISMSPSRVEYIHVKKGNESYHVSFSHHGKKEALLALHKKLIRTEAVVDIRINR